MRANKETGGISRKKMGIFNVGRSVLFGFGRVVGSVHGEGGSNISVGSGVGCIVGRGGES